HPGLDNASGLSWAASTTPGGTPGAPNSAAAEDIAPLVLDAAHFPLVPTSSDPVQVTARILDDHGAAVTASVHYRLDGDPMFSVLPMVDDGSHGDTLPGDGIFGATLPVQADGAIIEFYLTAADAAGHTRVWPAPALDQNGVPGQEANCLYQVDNTSYAAAMPLYRIVMRAADRTRLATINQTASLSHARMNATFISRTGTGSALRYRVGVRNRGNSSRGTLPQSFRVNFLQQEPWDGVVALNLNTQYTPHQLLGSAAFRKAGVTAAMARAVQLRVNAVNPASSTGSPAYGFYVANEVLDSDYADAHYPRDPGGNIYKCMQVDYSGSDPGADLGDQSDHPDPALADPTPYRENYFKQTNISEDDWSDLIGLTQALAKGASPTLDNPAWEPGYTAAVRQTADVLQWMRYFAANAIADNTETSLGNGRGDDYFMYFGKEDRRARLIPYDLDSIFGRSSSSSTSHSLWLMCRNNLLAGSPPTPVNPFIKHPEFAPLYYAELKRMIDGVFAPANFGALADEVLGGLVAPSVIGSMKTFNAGRTAWIAGQIPLGLSVTTAPPAQDGYPRVTSASASLAGRAHAITTRSVTVNGVPAAWTAWTATWTAPDIQLVPGVNRVLIQSFDADGLETGRLGYDVWYDDGTVQQVPASIDADTTWSAAEGPWQLSATVTVAAGATLTIEPGASVYLAGGARLTVAAGGRLLAEGTPTAPIRFLRTPGSSTAWGTLTINGNSGSPECRIAHARFDGNGSPAIDVNAGEVVLEHLEFGNTGAQYLSLDGASFVVSDCHFPDATANFELVHGTQGVKAGGRGIIRGCYFGVTTGYNDSIDFTGGQRPGPILQLIDNVFARSGDDQVDIDGTDCWIAGNIFLHTHKNGPPDSAAAISGGNNGSEVSRATIIGNLFYDHDHVITAKQGNFYTLIHNTIVRQTIRGGGDIDGGVINMRDALPEPPTTWGAGCLVVGNIIADAEKLIREDGTGATSVIFSNNLLPFEWTGEGAGNFVADPLFVRVPALEETDFRDWRSAQALREWLALRPGSPALGIGPGGRDLGGVVPLGAHLAGAPAGTTRLDSATLSVGPLFATGIPWASGFTHYVWRLDGGPWSAETPAATPLSLTGLAPGEHLVEVRARNDAGFYQDDAAYGQQATPAATAIWTVDPDFEPPPPQPLVRINEVLARNGDTLGYGSTFPDLIELHNAGTAAADLTGWGLTDNAALSHKYTFPPGTVLGPGQYILVHASASTAVPEPKTGFALKAEGDTLTLSRPPAEG
ncbi:MAG: CotH kinase family protein, partial [Akkermansiaceae bacterium]|nr:CotH kinase family protein [Akkermansiaceae bacterium]